MSQGERIPLPGPGGEPAGASCFVQPTRPVYRPRWWLHIALFIATFLSTTFIGALFWGDLPPEMALLPFLQVVTDPRFVLSGLKFSIPLLTILFAHEMGHYVACRVHGLTATPPFFIPFPLPVFGIGTLGAVIRIKEPIRNKRQLLDVGAAGPVAGFVALVPFLAFGIMASEVTSDTPEAGYLVFGEPLVYAVLESVLRPDVVDGTTLLLHPTGVAAWFGILVTLLNLLPFAQLDGGHVAYALFGRLHTRAAWFLVGGLVVLGYTWPGWWLWAIIAVIMRPTHPRIWDEDRPLDPRRAVVAWLTIGIFVLCFMLLPIEIHL